MTVILRIDYKPSSVTVPPAMIAFDLLSDLFPMHVGIAAVTSARRTVWHTGCPEHGCEGLRVLGTWKNQVGGWG